VCAGRRGTKIEGAAGAEVDAAKVVAGAVAAGDDKAGVAAVVRVGAGIGIRAFFAGGGGNEVRGVFNAGEGGVLVLPFELFNGGSQTGGDTISTLSSSSADCTSCHPLIVLRPGCHCTSHCIEDGNYH
jgi:hypothetical protein